MPLSTDELRQIYRKKRVELDTAALEFAAQSLAAQLIKLADYQNSQHIAAYFAVNGEIGLTPLIEHALANGKSVYLPILDEASLRFAPYTSETSMRINRFKLPEPDVPETALREPREFDLVLAPLVVFDASCNRIGMGGGYYDRSFEFRRTGEANRPLLIGVAHELQRVEHLQPEPWDVRLDAVVTDQHIVRP